MVVMFKVGDKVKYKIAFLQGTFPLEWRLATGIILELTPNRSYFHAKILWDEEGIKQGIPNSSYTSSLDKVE